MSQLETEIEGHAGCVGPAVPSEVWSVPAEHRYHSRAIGGVIRYAVLSLEKHQVNVKSTPESREFEIVAGSRDDVLHSAVVELSQAVEHVDDLSQMAKATLSDAICWHLEERYLCIPQTTDGETAYLLTKSDARLLRSFIYENLAERITIDMLARLVDLTTHRLLIAFRHAFRTTPAQYLIDQRLRKAQWLLLHTSHDVTRVSLDSGFSSHSHLSIAFRNRTRFSPTEFRRRFK